MVLFASPHKPFILTPKGTVSRPRTLDAYADEINAVYQAAEEASKSDLVLPEVLDSLSLLEYVQALTQEVSGRQLDASTDLFTQGFDR